MHLINCLLLCVPWLNRYVTTVEKILEMFLYYRSEFYWTLVLRTNLILFPMKHKYAADQILEQIFNNAYQ